MTTPNALIFWEMRFFHLAGGDEEQASRTWLGTVSSPSANADGLATDKEWLLLVTDGFHNLQGLWHQHCDGAEVVGGENLEGEGMVHTALTAH